MQQEKREAKTERDGNWAAGFRQSTRRAARPGQDNEHIVIEE